MGYLILAWNAPRCAALSQSQPNQIPGRTQTRNEGFWNDPTRVSSLPDPPSDELLQLIREKPYRGGFEPATEVPDPYSPRIVHGSIPRDLVGTLATNGPGRIRIGGRRYGHWFDGDGFVTSLAFDGVGGGATFRARYVATSRYVAQRKLMERLADRNKAGGGDGPPDNNYSPPLAFSGPWTPAGEGAWYENALRFPTNPGNTATLYLPPTTATGADGRPKPPRLFALCEGGHPIELDPVTLDLVQPEKPFASSDNKKKVLSFFSAHFSRCSYSGHIYNHGYLVRPGPLPK